MFSAKNNGKNNPYGKRARNTQIFGIVVAVLCLFGYFLTKDSDRGNIKLDAESKTEAENIESYSETAKNLVTLSGGPESGTEFYRRYENNPAVLHISNSSTADACIRCADGLFNKSVLEFYLRAGEEVTISVPVGYFELHTATGEKWENRDSLFGDNTLYFKDSSEHGQEFGRKKICEFTIEEGFGNLIPISGSKY